MLESLSLCVLADFQPVDCLSARLEVFLLFECVTHAELILMNLINVRVTPGFTEARRISRTVTQVPRF